MRRQPPKAGARFGPRLPLLPLLVLLVLAACVRDLSVPGVPTDAVALTVRASAPVAAAQFTLLYGPHEVRFVGLAPLDARVLARAYDDGAGTVRVALVSAEAVDGALVSAVFDGAEAPQVVVREAATYAPGGEAAGATLRLDRGDGVRPERAGPDARGAAWFPGALPAGLEPQAVAPAALLPSFADHPLGDLDRNGTIDVLDVLRDLDLAIGAATGDDYQRYSGDLVADDVIDAMDVVRLLDKAVDPTLAASLTVKPEVITYLDLTEGVPVLVGNSGNAPLSGLQISPSGVQGSITNGIPGQSAAFTFSGDPNDDFGAVTVAHAGGSQRVLVGNVVVLVAGQSNAEGQGLPMTNPETALDEGVRMFGNDYIWKVASEPVDSNVGQDPEEPSYDLTPLHSFGVRLGNRVRAATGRLVYLIPAALGGSNFAGNGNDAHGWNPDGVSPVYNPEYLSGSAIFRGLVSAGLQPNPVPNEYPAEGGPVRAVAWYQGESESRANATRNAYVASTRTLFGTFSSQFGGAAILFAQLAPHGRQTGDSLEAAIVKNLQQADIAERQRRMEAGALQFGTGATEPPIAPISPVTNAHLVVTHDLPMSDHIHLSAEGQRILGDRIALAVEEHVLGLDVDGTGPRLVSLGRPTTTTIEVRTSRTINSDQGPSAYEGYFTVFDGPPAGADIESPLAYGANALAISDIRRDPNDATAVRITLAEVPTATPYVRYMPPALRPFDANGGTSRLTHVVHDPDSGLPLPSFGPLAVP